MVTHGQIPPTHSVYLKLPSKCESRGLSIVDIIGAIYKEKKQNEKFVLSNGHSGIALYCHLKEAEMITENQIQTFNIHPDRDEKLGIDVSTGSLGQGWPISLGLALSNPTQMTYVSISDGESSEGSIWETARLIIDWNVTNLISIININGYGAYDKINGQKLISRYEGFGFVIIHVDGHSLSSLRKAILAAKASHRPTLIAAYTTVEQLPSLRGQDAHYHILTEPEFVEAQMIWGKL